MRLLGITQRVVVDSATGERRDALDQQWVRFLARCRWIGVPLPNQPEAALAIAKKASLQALVLSGGNDLAAYGGNAIERDQTENELLIWARKTRKPIIGVCRGAQYIAHSFGGNLSLVSNHAGTRHWLPQLKRETNSYHRYGIVTAPPLSENLILASDGSVESFAIPEHRILAIMWHPEREFNPLPEDVLMFSRHLGERN